MIDKIQHLFEVIKSQCLHIFSFTDLNYIKREKYN